MTSNEKTKSAALYERGLKVMPGGCSRNTILMKPHPEYADFAKGCRVTDIEGVERIDFSNNMTALIHGHADEEIIAAVTEQLAKGTCFTLGTELEVEFAEYLCSRSQGFEKLRFVNSGTEAVMSGLKAARAYTGRAKIAKVEGAYHGLYDHAEVSQTSNADNWGDADNPNSNPVSHGTPQATLDDVIVLPFNNVEVALSILDKHKENIACVLMDLMPHRVGLIPASTEFFEAIHKWTRANGALILADEVITFRSELGGLQDRHSVKPDLTAMGKMVGGGFPVGALAGRAEVMDVMNPLMDKVLFPHSGTFSANPITMAAGLTAMKKFDQQAVNDLNAMGDYTRSVLEEAIKIADAKACVTGTGSMLRIHMRETAPINYRDNVATPDESVRLKALLNHLFHNGIIMINTCTAALSTAITKTEVDRLGEVMLEGLRKTK